MCVLGSGCAMGRVGPQEQVLPLWEGLGPTLRDPCGFFGPDLVVAP